ncbi:MAG: radical SAM protein [Firmicutes bacterium]|nr:radical SAM protein [Bacillota bacterium]
MHFTEAKSLLIQNKGHVGMNIYRGCSHGCIYCDSRSKCYGFTHDFEDIEVKKNAPELLEKALRSKRNKCMIGTGSMSDPYMHCEKELELTRECLKTADKLGFGFSLLTKSDMVMRDIDILSSINEKARAVLQMTVTTFDDELCRKLEPNVCPTSRRLEVLREFSKRGIDTAVWLSPVLPFINDTEENIGSILEGCAEAGVKAVVCFGMGLTLREGNREYYFDALDRLYTGLKERYMKLYGNSYMVMSPDNGRLMKIFRDLCADHGIICDMNECFEWMDRFPEKSVQISMFDMMPK